MKQAIMKRGERELANGKSVPKEDGSLGDGS